jgi:hypothetical protein
MPGYVLFQIRCRKYTVALLASLAFYRLSQASVHPPSLDDPAAAAGT